MALENIEEKDKKDIVLDLNSFKQNFLYGNRGHHFAIGLFLNPILATNIDDDLIKSAKELFIYLNKNSQTPSSEMGNTIELPWHGKNIALPGDKIASKSVDINFWYDDVAKNVPTAIPRRLREFFEAWSDFIDSHGMLGVNVKSYPQEFKSTMYTMQYDINKGEVNSYRYVGVWPEKVGEILNAHDGQGILEYTITFRYDWDYNVNLTGKTL